MTTTGRRTFRFAGARFLLTLAVLIAALQRVDHVTNAAVNTWSSRGPDLAPVPSIAVDPSNDSVVLAATGRIFRTTNGGLTWNTSDAGLPVSGGRLQSLPSEIAFATSTRAYVVTSAGVARSDDGGISWMLIPASPSAFVLAVDPTDPNTVYVANNAAVSRSTDAGGTWTTTTVAAGAFIFDLGLAASDASRVYVGTTRGVFRSQDAGGTWSAANSGLPLFGSEPYVPSLVASPTNADLLYAGTANSQVYRSTDGGNSWAALATSPGIYTVAMDPQDPLVLLGGSQYIGPYRTTNGGAQWLSSSTGMTPHLPESFAFSPSNHLVVYAGSYGAGVFRSSNGGATWSPRSAGLQAGFIDSLTAIGNRVYAGGTGGVVSIAPTDGAWLSSGSLPYLGGGGNVRGLAYDSIGGVLYAAVYGHTMLTSMDGGATWVPKFTGLASSGGVIDVAVDPAVGGTAYALGQFGCFKTTNSGDSWTALPGLPAANFRNIAVDPDAPQTVYVGTTAGLYRTADGGSTWALPPGLPATDVRAVATAPQAFAYAAIGNSVYRSADGGNTWSLLGLPVLNVNALAADPSEPETVWAGSTGGAWEWRKGSSSWQSIGLPGFDIAALLWVPGTSTLFAGTRLAGVQELTPAYTLSISAAGPGTVQASSPAISCPGICTADVPRGVVATLTATPAPSSDFVGWSGACTGTSSCTVTMNGPRSVTATFINPPPTASNSTLNLNEDTPASGTFDASDVHGEPLTFSIVANGTLGTAVVTNAQTGAFTYTPLANANGTDTVTFRANDGVSDSNVAAVTINIAAVNDAPTAANATLTVSAGASASGTFNATDVDSPTLTFGILAAGTKGTAVLTNVSTGAYTYTANPNTSGADTVTFTASDGTATSNVGTVSVTINPAPSVGLSFTSLSFRKQLAATSSTAPRYSVGSLPAFVVAGDFNGDGKIDLAAANQIGNSTSILLNTGTGTFGSAVTYPTGSSPTAIAARDFNGDGFLDLAVTGQSSRDVSVLLGNGNGTFQSAVRYASGQGATAGAFGIAAADFNADGAIDLAVANANSAINLLLGAGNGTFTAGASLNASGSLDVASGDFNGDGKADLATAHFVLLGNGDGTFQPAVGLNAPGDFITLADYNGDGKLDVAIASRANPSTVALRLGNGNGTFINGSTFAVGRAPFFMSAGDLNNDGNVDLAVSSEFDSSVSVLLGNGNGTFQPFTNYGYDPSAESVAIADVNGDGSLDLSVANLFGNSVSVLIGRGDGTFRSSLTVSVTNTGNAPLHIGTVDTIGPDASSVFVEAKACPAALDPTSSCPIVVGFRPATSGLKFATLRINSDAGGSPQTVGLSGLGVSAPIAQNGSLTTNEDAAAPGQLTATDADGDPLLFSLVTTGVLGTAAITNFSTGSFTYTPNANATGTDVFTFKANDGSYDSNTATITVTIAPVNDPPVIGGPDLATTAEDTPVQIRPADNDTDPDGTIGQFTITSVTQPAHGAVTQPGTLTLLYTPAENFNGSDSFTYTITDTGGATATGTVQVTVTPVNDPPVIVGPDVATTAEDTSVEIRPADNDVDPDGPTGQFAISGVTQPSHGAVSQSDGFTVLYTPAANFNGSDTFTYTITDTGGVSATGTVSVTVTPVNDAPVANGGVLSVTEDTPTTGTFTASDVDGTPLTYVIVANGARGRATVTNPTTGAFTYSPYRNVNGNDAFSFVANDGTASSNVAVVNVTIAAVNDPPIAYGQSALVVEDSGVPLRLAASDDDGNALTFQVVTAPTHGTLSGTLPDAVYTPAANYNGPDSFTFTASDGTPSRAATVALTVTPSLWSTHGPEGGGASALAISPGTPSTLYAAGNTIFRSIDAGVTWSPPAIDFPWTSPNVIAIDPAMPTTVYVAVSEGIVKSLDGGATWALKNSGITDLVNGTRTVAVDPTSSSTLYAVAGEQIYKSTDGAETWTLSNSGMPSVALRFAIDPSSPSTVYAGTSDKVFKSMDGGATWANASSGLSGSLVQALAIDPQNPNTLYAALFGAGVFKTTNGGASWLAANSGISNPNFRGLAIDAASPNIVYALTATGVFKSNNGGSTWVPAMTGLPSNLSAFVLVIDARNSGTLYLSGNALFNTTNGGASWSAIGSGLLTSTSRAVVSDGVNPETVYAADARGVYKTTTHGTAWTATGTLTSIPQALAVDPIVPSTLYAATNGGMFKTLNSGGAWTPINSGLTSTNVQAVAVNPVTPSTVYASTTTGGVFKTTNGGGAWAAANAGLTGLNVRMVAIDPLAPDTLYATNNVVFKSTNGGATWTSANNGLPGVVTALAVSPDTAGVVYAAAFNGVYKTSDGGVSWTPVNNGLPPFSNVSTLSVDRTTGAVYAGMLLGGVFKTTDGGANWTALEVGLPGVGINGLATSADTPRVYAATFGGVYVFDQAANDPPVADSQSVTVAEDGSIAVRLSASDVDGQAVTFTVANPVHGTLIGVAPNLTYTPQSNYNGPDGFTFTASDGIDISTVATVSITVTPINDAPAASDDTYTTAEDTTLIVSAPGVLANDTDADGDSLTVSLTTGPAHGTLSLNGSGSFTYVPAANFNGPDVFTYTATDSDGAASTASIQIDVTPVNDAPTVADQTVSLSEDTSIVITLSGADVDGQALTFAVSNQPGHGTLTGVAPNLSYRPAANYNGPDSFTFTATDGVDVSNTATVSIAVDPVNDVPVAASDTYSTSEDTVLNVPANTGVLADDIDVDGETLSSQLVSSPSHGALLLSANGSFSYTPAANYHGNDSFTYIAKDASTSSLVTIVTIVVSSVNDVPQVADDSYITNLNTSLSIAAPGVLTNDTDADADALTTVQVAGVAHGTLIVNPSGSFTYTPATNYSGPDSFTYRASDGTDVSAPATVSLTVTAPVAVANPGGLTFPNQLLFIASASQTVTLTNTGNGALSVGAVTLTGSHPADFASSNNCAAAVAPGGSCTISVAFTPLVAGARTATLQVATNAVASPAMVSLSGTGVKGASTTTLTSSPNPSGFTQPVTLSANVSAVAPSTGVPSGSVQFFDGATALGSVSVAANGVAALTTIALSSGSHSLTAAYSGNANFATSTSGTVTQIVNGTATSTQTTLTSTPNPSALNEVVVLEAVVAPLSGTARPAGTVQFYDNGTLRGSATLVLSKGSMRAQFTTSTLGTGTHTLTAQYLGNSAFGGSTSPTVGHSVYQGVKPTTTTTTVIGSPNPSAPGQIVTLTATVTAKKSQPTGMVQFYVDNVALGAPVATDAAGQAAIQISTLSLGFHIVTAQYMGAATFASSTGNVAQSVQ